MKFRSRKKKKTFLVGRQDNDVRNPYVRTIAEAVTPALYTLFDV